MKKIAYIELDTHAEIAQYFLELMKDSAEFSVDYYFSDSILKQLQLSTSDNVFVSSPEAIVAQFSDRSYDLVIIGTVHRYFAVFEKISAQYNSAIIVHNINFSKSTPFQLFKNIFRKETVFRLKLLLNEGLLRAPMIYRSAKNLLVLDKKLALEKRLFLPLFFSQFQNQYENQIPVVVIPGAVSQSRRDYRHVLQQLKKFQSNFQIVFLGKAEGKELLWLQNFQEEGVPNIELVFFTEKIPKQQFDEWMQKADLLWCPVNKETEFFSVKEIYGKTKVSGNVGDAIKYEKPSVFPADFGSDYPFIIKEEQNVESQFLDILNSKKNNFHQQLQKSIVLRKLELVLHQIC